MRIIDKELRGIPVETRKGERIGKLAGFVVDVDEHAVVQYVVNKTRWLSAILPGELLVHPSQVISINDERMVVKDEAVTVKAAAALRVHEAASTSTTATRSEG
jgi:uncharacterized protein YrrD